VYSDDARIPEGIDFDPADHFDGVEQDIRDTLQYRQSPVSAVCPELHLNSQAAIWMASLQDPTASPEATVVPVFDTTSIDALPRRLDNNEYPDGPGYDLTDESDTSPMCFTPYTDHSPPSETAATVYKAQIMDNIDDGPSKLTTTHFIPLSRFANG